MRFSSLSWPYRVCLAGLGLSVVAGLGFYLLSLEGDRPLGMPADISARTSRWLCLVLATMSLAPLIWQWHTRLRAEVTPPTLLSRCWPILLAAYAAVPFWWINVAHFADPAVMLERTVPTGFVQSDQPYYLANGRDIFERGNGFMNPNPYDPRPDAPVIYFHWLIWVLGFGVTWLGCDPGLWLLTLGVLGGWVCSLFTFKLVSAVVQDRRWELPCFLLAMWGGGAFVLWEALAWPPLHGSLAQLFIGDPFYGDWCLNWGRNLFYPTEAIYHALVAIAWWAVVVRRPALALSAICVLAATHPFSGAEHLAIITAWFGLRCAVKRQRLDLWLLMAVAACAAFVGYYLWYLRQFPEHRELQAYWESMEWTFDWDALILAHLLVLPPAIHRLLRDGRNLSESTCFFLLAFLVALLLSKHELFLAPRQPLHFTRGYTWLPLLLIGWPSLLQSIRGLQARLAGWPLAAALGGLALVFCSDNAAWVAMKSAFAKHAYYLTPDGYDILQAAQRRRLRGLLVCPDLDLSYLSATYTALDPYYGHGANTPRVKQRVQTAKDFFASFDKPDFADVEQLKQTWDYLIIPASEEALFAPQIEVLHRNQTWLLAGRKTHAETRP